MYSFFTGRKNLFIGGKEVPKVKGGWQTSDGRFIAWKQDLTFLPKLKIDGDEIKLIKFKKWEWVFVFFPLLLVFRGGVVGGLIGGVAMSINFSIFASSDIKPILKALASLGVFILTVAVYFFFVYRVLGLVR